MGTSGCVMDASDLPSADRMSYSDPYGNFQLNGNEVDKTKTQKKTFIHMERNSSST